LTHIAAQQHYDIICPTHHAHTHTQVFYDTFGLPVDEVPLAAFTCALSTPSVTAPQPGTLFVSQSYLAFASSVRENVSQREEMCD
jgi:hypothetical protein